jgi:hypothetical protein
MKGLFFYLFLAAIIVWDEVIALRLKSVQEN